MSNIIPEGIWSADPYQSASAATARDYYRGDVLPLSDTAEMFSAAVKDQNPISAQPQTEADANVVGSFFDDWYFRIHLLPGTLPLGNLLSTQTRELKVWNAFLDEREVESFDYPLDQGVSVAEPAEAPYDLRALEFVTYVVSVSIDGPPRILLAIDVTIDGVEYSVSVTGNRLVVWPFPPNWKNSPTETFEWLTGVSTAKKKTEKRTSLRNVPRRELDYSILARREDTALMRNLLHGWQGRLYALPIWTERMSLAASVSAGDASITVDATLGRTLVPGANVVIYAGTKSYETVEIASIVGDEILLVNELIGSWPASTRAYPVAVAALSTGVNVTYETSAVTTARTTWRMQAGMTDDNATPGAAPATYRGIEFLDRHPNWGESVRQTVEQDAVFLDAQTGRFALGRSSDVPELVTTSQWVAKNAAELRELRNFFARRRGRAVPVYMPSHFDDFKLLSSVSAGADTMSFEDNGYAQLLEGNELRRDIQIELRNGNKYVRRIASAESLGGNVMTVSLDDSLPESITPADVKTIHGVSLLRLAGDKLTLTYLTDSVATMRPAFLELRNP